MGKLQRYVVMAGLILMLLGSWGCAATTAPREFAPDGTVIQQAIAFKLNHHYQDLSRTIATVPPTLELKNIQVQSLDSFFLKQLPVYHLRGTYDITLTFPHQADTRKHNAFEVYLQRQTEGKTWRSLQKTAQGWHSTQLPP
jgi:hypothetical protein